MTDTVLRSRAVFFATLGWTLLLAAFFANVEIQIEGAHGWAASLPTWHVAPNLLLDIFWGGREMTGYHAWLFPFMALAFHFPLVAGGHWSWRAEARTLGCLALFWLAEDFLWFVFNPAYGLAHFGPRWVSWHPHWWAGLPVDYWVFSLVAALLLWCSWPGATAPHARDADATAHVSES